MRKRAILVVLMTFLIFVIVTAGALATDNTGETRPVWPVPGHYSLSQGYHGGNAIDISDGSICGATIVAAMDGTVKEKFTCAEQHYGSYGDCHGFGTGLVIAGVDGKYYEYAHMQANSIPADIKVGSTVSAGQVIGRVGTTGYSSGYHLHFGISYDSWGGPGLDPTPSKIEYTYSDHTHIKGVFLYYDETHPHYGYWKCSICGMPFADGTTVLYGSCKTCYPQIATEPVSFKISTTGSCPPTTLNVTINTNDIYICDLTEVGVAIYDSESGMLLGIQKTKPSGTGTSVTLSFETNDLVGYEIPSDTTTKYLYHFFASTDTEIVYSRIGYFDGWSDGFCNNTYLIISFDPIEGSCPSRFVIVRTSSKYGVLPIPTRPGYRFSGWAIDPPEISRGNNGIPTFIEVIGTGSYVSLEDNTTVYALWNANEYIVTDV